MQNGIGSEWIVINFTSFSIVNLNNGKSKSYYTLKFNFTNIYNIIIPVVNNSNNTVYTINFDAFYQNTFFQLKDTNPSTDSLWGRAFF